MTSPLDPTTAWRRWYARQPGLQQALGTLRLEPLLMGVLLRSRLHILQHLIDKRHYTSYLEIGCYHDYVFSRISIPKVGVDPASGGTKRMTSDAFFAENRATFDLILVDGLHHRDQAITDIDNALRVLNSGGTIVVHDCNPQSLNAQIVPRRVNKWNGDVWKAWMHFRKRPDLRMFVVDVDEGCGVIQAGSQQPVPDYTEDYHDLARHRREWLNLISAGDFLRTIS